MLEPYEGKLSRTVLRGESGSNTADPLDYLEDEDDDYLEDAEEESNEEIPEADEDTSEESDSDDDE